MYPLFRSRFFWLACLCTSIAAAALSFKYFSRAFPIVNLKLSMDRAQALEKAAAITGAQNLGPAQYIQTATFESDEVVKTFVELEAGGAQAFNEMVTGALYSPYTWRVRHCKEFQTNEVTVTFKPDGTPYGFVEKIAEQAPGPSLSAEQAEEIARTQATTNWGINFADFTRVEHAQETRPNGRTDHLFVYERPTARVGSEGRYRVRAVVSGDKLTQVSHFVKVPEPFIHKYTEMRSSNATLASAAFLFMYLIYYFLIGIFGLIFLLKNRWIEWKPAIFLGVFVALVQAAAKISEYPLIWTYYDTTTPVRAFIFQFLISTIIQTIQTTVLIAGTVALAEGLTRKAFGHHPQFWKLWSKDGAASVQIAGRTVFGYLLVPLDILYCVAFYLLTSRFLGWWQPSEQLFDPNILANYVPWINAVAPSLKAGLWEECLCRAFPIATAALLAKRYGKRSWWMVGAFLLQAFIFGAAHANYPAQPAYARLVELLVFSLITGFIYLRFGLWTCIVSHFVYDLVWFSFPLFVSSAAHAWMGQLIIILIGAIPLFIVLARWLQTRTWRELPQTLYNAAWQPGTPEMSAAPASITFNHTVTPHHWYTALGAFVAGIALLIFSMPYTSDVPPLEVTRTQAIALGTQAIAQQLHADVHDWYPITSVRTFNQNTMLEDQHRFVWQKHGNNLYQGLLSTYLIPASWHVRFIRLNGSLEERAEEYTVLIDGHQKARSILHKLPQERAGATLSESDARTIANSAFKERLELSNEHAKEISAISEQHPHRLDWQFTCADTRFTLADNAQARADVLVDGDQVSGYYRYIHVPEEWARAQNTQRAGFGLVNLCSWFILMLLCAGAGYIYIRTIGVFAAPKNHVVLLLTVLGLFFTLRMALSMPALLATLNAQEPYTQQLFRILAGSCMGILLTTLGLAFCITSAGGLATRLCPVTDKKLPLIGIAAGTLTAGLLLFAGKGVHLIEPLWPDCSALNAYWPSLLVIMNNAAGFMASTSILAILTAALIIVCSKHHCRWFLKVLLFVAGLVIAGTSPLVSWPVYLAKGAALGISFNACIFLLGQSLVNTLPVVTLTIAVISYIEKALIGGFTGASMAHLASIFVVGSMVYLWQRQTSR